MSEYFLHGKWLVIFTLIFLQPGTITMKMIAFWDVAQCNPGVDWRFIGSYFIALIEAVWYLHIRRRENLIFHSMITGYDGSNFETSAFMVNRASSVKANCIWAVYKELLHIPCKC
jgi:hypothetical protein